MRARMRVGCSALAAALCAVGPSGAARAAATIVVVNYDGAGTGFNDPTPATPIGGNTGTTLGQQRLIAFQAATNLWGAAVTSSVTITIRANFSGGIGVCHAGSAIGLQFLTLFVNSPGVPFADTIYVPALARKFAGTTLGTTLEDFALSPCNPPGEYYLGLDNNHGAQLDLVSEVSHAIAHGLGFWNTTGVNGGAYFGGRPGPWDRFLLDTTTNKLWINMTETERIASAANTGKVVWTGANVTAAVPSVLLAATRRLTIGGSESGAAAGEHAAWAATFGSAPTLPAVARQLMPTLVGDGGSGGACSALGALDALAVSGNVALLQRGGCADVAQAKNVQLAGALGAIMIDAAGNPSPPGPTGVDPTVVIPTVSISSADGSLLESLLRHRGRRASGVTATLETVAGAYFGADALGRAIVYTPAAFEGSAARSHWDPAATPNQLLESTLNGDVPHAVGAPNDLSLALLRDLGW